MKKVVNLGLSCMIASVILTGCLSDGAQPDYNAALNSQLAAVDPIKLAEDLNTIDDSLANWGVVASHESHGVRYTIDSLGSGPKPTLGSYISVKYKGKRLTDQFVFDQGNGSIPFYLYQLIIGWQTTLPLLPEGTKATLYIPSGFAYGPVDKRDGNGNIVIPKNSNLIFEIQLLKVY